VTTQEEDLEYKKIAKSDAVKIVNSLNQKLTKWPPEIGLFRGSSLSHIVLKSKVIAVLGLTELNCENADKFIPDIEAELKLTYSKVDEGKRYILEKTSLGGVYFPPAFYLDYLEKSVLTDKVPPKFYRFYFLLALVELVSFEKLRLLYGELDGCDGFEKEAAFYKKSIICLAALIRAQAAVELGSDSLERSLGNKRFQDQQAILDRYRGPINAEEGRIKYIRKIRENYLPQILEVNKKVEGGRGVAESCGHVLNDLELTTGNDDKDKKAVENLRSQYYKWRKNPDGYLPEDS